MAKKVIKKIEETVKETVEEVVVKETTKLEETKIEPKRKERVCFPPKL